MQKPKIIYCEDGKVFIERFSLIRRSEHIFTIFIFTILVLTGFPQKFYETAWLNDVIDFIGGLDRARVIHRITGIVFSIHMLIHLLYILVGTILKTIQLSLLPSTQDFKNLVASMKFYFGYQKERPHYAKFNFQQKFEYLNIISAGIVMIFSGLILLLPIFFTNFFGGQVVPAARIAHSNEALLAILVILIWHIYGSHFAPETFPMDKTIFTGLIEKNDLKKRHFIQYNELFDQEDQEKTQEKKT